MNKTKWKYKYKVNGELNEIELSVELFTDIGENNFAEFKRLTDEIKEWGSKKNDILQNPMMNIKKDEMEKRIKSKERSKEDLTQDEMDFKTYSKEIEKVAQERGQYFNRPNEKIFTQNYKNLCEFYKNIALKLGQNKARILGYQKQIVDSEKLKFYAVIVENGNHRELALIPKGKENLHQKAHSFLNNPSHNNPNGSVNIYSFKSLTLRALQKLCFKEDKEVLIEGTEQRNTFIGNIEKELLGNPSTQNKKYFFKGKLKRFDEFKIYDKNLQKKDWNTDEKLLIEFYQDVLKTTSAQSLLDIKDFGLESVLSNKFDTLDDFEIALEQVAYLKNITHIDDDGLKNFYKQCGAFVYKINSQDLSIDDKNHKNKKHTDYWLDFWTEENMNAHYSMRINPEFSLYYTLANEDFKDKSENGLLKQPVKLAGLRNRKLKNQLIFTTTFSLNANKKMHNLAFLDTKELQVNIHTFNEKLESDLGKKHTKNDTWHFGIDRGINELATLSITKYLESKNEKGVQNFEFAKIPCLKLKETYDRILDIQIDEHGKTKYIFEKLDYTDKNGHARTFEVAKNVSYFLDKTELLEEVTTGIIDLTQAKRIGNTIVLNGDKTTYLKLKELSAKRRLFEYSSELATPFEFSSGNGNTGIFVKLKNGKYIQIYWFNNDLSFDSQEKQEIKTYKTDLQNKLISVFTGYCEYLQNENKFEDLETILKINHLRDALTANMVGIIHFFMMEKGFAGKISMENLDESMLETGIELEITKKRKFNRLEEYTGDQIRVLARKII